MHTEEIGHLRYRADAWRDQAVPARGYALAKLAPPCHGYLSACRSRLRPVRAAFVRATTTSPSGSWSSWPSRRTKPHPLAANRRLSTKASAPRIMNKKEPAPAGALN